MTHSHFQFRLLFSRHLRTTSSLAPSQFLYASAHGECVCLCRMRAYRRVGGECVLCCICGRVLMVTEVIANVKTQRKPRSVRGREREAVLLLHVVVQKEHTHTHRYRYVYLLFGRCACIHTVWQAHTHTYTLAHTHSNQVELLRLPQPRKCQHLAIKKCISMQALSSFLC